MFYIFVSLCLLGNTLASSITQAALCPEMETQKDFDFEKFQGQWFQHSIMDVYGAGKCVTENYSHPGNGTFTRTLTYIQRNTGILKSLPYEILVPDPADPAKMLIRPLHVSSSTVFRILDTDYVSYAFTCIYSYARDRRNVPVHISQGIFYTRDQNAREALAAKADELIEKYKFDKWRFGQVKQDDCVLRPSK